MNRHNFNERTTAPDMDALARLVAERPTGPMANVGDRRTIAGHTFTAIAAEPYTRRDSTPSKLVTWRSECATCGAAYEAKGSRNPAHLPVNCEKHRGRHARRARPRRGLRIAIERAIGAIDAGDVKRARELLAAQTKERGK